MAGSFLLLVLLLGLLLLVLGAAVAVAVLVTSSRASGPGPGPAPAPVRDGRRAGLRWAGLVAGLVAAWLVAGSGTLGRGVLLAAPVAALGVLLGVLAAELAVRPPSGPRRSASLATRRPGDLLPRALSAVVTATGVTLLVLVGVTTALGSADDMGRPGRSLTYACSAVETSSRGPWPGWFYTWPLLVVVAVGVLLALVVLHATVARPPLAVPAGVHPAQAQQVDRELRAQAGRAVVAGLGVLLAVPLAGTALLAAVAVGGMSGCAPGWWSAAGAALGVLSLAAVLVLLWCAGVVLRSGRPVAPAVPAGRA